MSIYDVLLIASWVLLAVIIAVAGCVLMGADWRTTWTRMSRRNLRRSRS